MAGTVEGGRKARDTNLKRDPAFYAKIGSIGGKLGHRGGFNIDDRNFLAKLLGRPTRAQKAGAKGGSISKRRKVNG